VKASWKALLSQIWGIKSLAFQAKASADVFSDSAFYCGVTILYPLQDEIPQKKKPWGFDLQVGLSADKFMNLPPSRR
jgi:hypothetical protein